MTSADTIHIGLGSMGDAKTVQPRKGRGLKNSEGRMELSLDLSRHCIETEIRRHYNRALSAYFRTDERRRDHLEQIIDGTQEALEKWDFGRMRSAHRALAGGSDAGVVLGRQEDKLVLLVDGSPVEPILLRR